MLVVLIIISCSSDNNEQETQNQKPLATLTIQVNESKITGTLIGADSDGTITNKTVKITNSSNSLVETITVVGNSFSSRDLVNDTYMIEGTVIDNNGEIGTDTKSEIINVPVETFIYVFNQTVNAIDENNSSAVVIGSLNQTGSLAFTSHEFTSGGDKFELVGNDVRRKAGADHEASANDSFTLLLKRSGQTDISLSGSVTINNVDESTAYSYCGGHGETVIVRDDSGTDFVAAPDGTASTTKVASFQSSLTTWSEIGQLDDLASDLDINSGGHPLFTAFNLDWLSTGIVRPGGGADNSMTLTNFGKILEKLETSFSFTYNSYQDYLGANITTMPNGYQWRLVFFYVAENIAKENTSESLNSDTVINQIILDVIQSMKNSDGSEITNSQALALLTDFNNDSNTHTGGISNGSGLNCN